MGGNKIEIVEGMGPRRGKTTVKLTQGGRVVREREFDINQELQLEGYITGLTRSYMRLPDMKLVG